MKHLLFCPLFLLASLPGYCQLNKFLVGDIGIRYQLDYNGALQNQVSVSDFIKKNLELGGTVSLVYSITRTGFTGTAPLPQNRSSDTLYTFTSGNTTWSYSLGFSPYLLYHFRIPGKFDLYGGGLLWFGISENSNNYSSAYYSGSIFNSQHFYNAPVEQTDGELANPPTYSVGAGPVIGCQYFLSKRLALGIQAGVIFYDAITPGNPVFYQDQFGPGANSILSATIVQTGLNGGQVSGYAGVTISYYIAKKVKGTSINSQ